MKLITSTEKKHIQCRRLLVTKFERDGIDTVTLIGCVDGCQITPSEQGGCLLGVLNPSPLKTCPKCPPHAVHVISVLVVLNELSTWRLTAPGTATIVRLSLTYFVGSTHTIKEGWPSASTLYRISHRP